MYTILSQLIYSSSDAQSRTSNEINNTICHIIRSSMDQSLTHMLHFLCWYLSHSWMSLLYIDVFSLFCEKYLLQNPQNQINLVDDFINLIGLLVKIYKTVLSSQLISKLTSWYLLFIMKNLAIKRNYNLFSWYLLHDYAFNYFKWWVILKKIIKNISSI